MRDAVVDFVKEKSVYTGQPVQFFLDHLALTRKKYNDWQQRYGKKNVHNGNIPRDHWLEQWEKDEIVKFYLNHDLEGYRRCTYMMMDQDIVFCSPATVYRVLKQADVMRSKGKQSSKKGTGFIQPDRPHQHWHTDITNVTIGDTIYFLITVLDGYSRFIVHTELRESMKSMDTQIVIQRAKEMYPNETPRLISDNGTQYKAKDFQSLLKQHGMTHVTTSPHYPQSNGKQERWHYTLKSEALRVSACLTKKDAVIAIERYVKFYNEKRLHSSINYVPPLAKLEGREAEILKERERKLENRRIERQLSNKQNLTLVSSDKKEAVYDEAVGKKKCV